MTPGAARAVRRLCADELVLGFRFEHAELLLLASASALALLLRFEHAEVGFVAGLLICREMQCLGVARIGVDFVGARIGVDILFQRRFERADVEIICILFGKQQRRMARR